MKRRPLIERAFPLADIEIARGGTGRTVTAYAAMFDAPYEVRDSQGHYFEQINRAGWNRWLAVGDISRAIPLFNHGLTAHGTPSSDFTLPLGKAVEIRAETRGLLTVTEYSNTALADQVLELIRDGAIKGQSFRGAIYNDRRIGSHGSLPLIERMDLGLKDYGPTPFPVNAEALIMSVRSAALVDRLREELEGLDDDERREVLAQIADIPGESEPLPTDPSDETEDIQPPPAALGEPASEEGPSLDVIAAAQANRRRRIGF